MSSHSAARVVYNTMELRHSIYLCLGKMDRRTLARMMVLERAGMAAVAEILYEKVHVSMLDILKTTARSDIYSTSVRTLDISPRPTLHGPPRMDAPLPYHQINVKTLRTDVSRWREQLPQLRTVLYQYPSNPGDDAFVVHLDGDELLVDLESHVMLDAWAYPFTLPILPSTPIHAGVKFRHTFTITMFEGSRKDWPRGGPGAWPDYQGHFDKWKAYLYLNPELDERITGIDTRACEGPYFKVTPAENLFFLSQRKSAQCQPMTHAHIAKSDIIGRAITLPHFLEVLSCLSDQLRWLSIPESFFRSNHPRRAIAILDALFPGLHHLTLSSDTFNFYPLFSGKMGNPLSGLPNLRKLQFLEAGAGSVQLANARVLSGLGAQECVFLNRSMNVRGPAEYHNQVMSWRKRDDVLGSG